LRGELSRWRKNERARLAARLVEKPVQNRKKKCGRLAASGAGTCKDITAVQCRWDGVVLDWGRSCKSKFFDATQKVSIEMKN